MTYTTWDIETTTTHLFGRKASPFTKSNWVVTHALKNKGGVVNEYRFGKQAPGPGWLRTVLANTRLLVGFNIKFDLLHALQDSDNLDAWMDYVVGGGRIWDCQLAEYLLCGMDQPNQMLSLDEVAPRYGGNVKVDEVKALWAAGVQTEDIDPELLTRYLCGGNDENGVYQKGDIENTEAVFLGQLSRSRECGQLNSLLLNMGALMCSIEMERNGLFADKGLGLVLAKELEELIVNLRAGLNAYLPPNLPFDFNWGSRVHKSALIFGGTVYYAGMEYVHADGTGTECGTWESADPTTRKVLTYPQMDVVCVQPLELDVPLKPHDMGDGWISQEVAKLSNCPVVRFGSGKRAGEVKTKTLKQPDHNRPKKRKCDIAYTFPRMTEPKKSWESAEKGVYSVAEDVIEELKLRGIPFVKALAALQKAVKDLGTYFIVTDANGKQKGMLTLVGEDGIIHHSINHTNTVTGRLSASNP
jgi:DNA polymerase I